jgi:hypothetical protein
VPGHAAGRLGANFSASTGVYTAPATGFYRVSAGIDYVASVTGSVGEFYKVFVVANGASACSASNPASITASIDHPVNVSCMVSLTAGQTVVIQALQNSGAAVALSASAALNFVSINRIP